MSRCPHTSFNQNKTIVVKLRDGTEVRGKFRAKRSGSIEVLTKDRGKVRIPVVDIRWADYARGPDPR